MSFKTMMCGKDMNMKGMPKDPKKVLSGLRASGK
jgi:hypothetical protein